MRLWMIVSEPAFQRLRSCGELITDGRRAWRHFRPAYRWMAQQMVRRIGPPPRKRAYPLWAWAQWGGPGRPKPDMRCSAHAPPGSVCHRLTLELPEDRVLLSDFDSWHIVLNGGNLSWSEEEDEAFDAALAAAGAPLAPPYPASFQERVEASWERIFDFTCSGADPVWIGTRESIQATFWRLEETHVMKAEKFIAR